RVEGRLFEDAKKLRQWQDLGHEVVLLFGTFTGMIGDPSDKSATRVKLTREQIDRNVSDYANQASKILDLSENAKNPIQIQYNHEWLSPINFEGVVDLASNFTIQQMLERSMFKNRIQNNQPVYLHEVLYPLMQGFDSVAMDVDIEVGGKDQIFNMLVGRDLMKIYKQKEKWVLPTKLIEDPSGKKMGKTEGNIVSITDLPEVKYEAIMTWPDTAIPLGLELITSVPMESVNQIQQLLETGKVNPVELKEAFAYRVVSELDGHDNAIFAQEEFNRVKRLGELPSRMPESSVIKGSKLSAVLVSSGLVKTQEEAFSLVRGGAIHVDGAQVKKDIAWNLSKGVLTIGKKTIKNARVIHAE
ncbi:MAG: tyrosine--tRNA ligase, partial [Patescibacteria group bacterium]